MCRVGLVKFQLADNLYKTHITLNKIEDGLVWWSIFILFLSDINLIGLWQ